MSMIADVLKTLQQVVLMNHKIEMLEKVAEKQEEAMLDLMERVIRIEVLIEMARPAAQARALPPTGG